MAKGGYKGSSPARETSPEEYSGVWDIVEQYGEQKAGSWPFQKDNSAPKSLRFDEGGVSNLTKTFVAAGNRRVFTWNFWVKPATQSENNIAVVGSGSPNSIRFNTNGTFQIKACGGSLTTSAVFRDFSAWYGITVAVNSSAPVASDRIKLFVNGEDFTSNLTGTSATLNGEADWNTAATHYIGKQEHNNSNMLDGLLSEVTFIDGQALSCEEFGFFDGQGIWQPKRFTGDYATGTVWSNYLTATNGGFHAAPYNEPAGFNGFVGSSSGGYVQTANGTANPNSLTFTPPVGIPYNEKVEVWLINNANTVSVNGGTAQSIAGTQWVQVATGPGTLTSIKFERPSTNGASFGGIRIDGIDLTDPVVGRNSFHLDFSQDEVGEVKDQSGLGNNWTANNIEGPAKGLLSDIVVSGPSQVTLASSEYWKMMNGNKDDFAYAHSNNATNYIEWTPTGGYPTNGHIWIQGGDGNGNGTTGMTVAINGSTVSHSAVVDNETYTQAGYGWGDWHKYAVAGNTLTSLRLTGAYALIRQLSTVDDPTHSVLGISNDNDVPAIVDTRSSVSDYFIDSPVNGNEASTGAGNERRGNYCCFNPLDKHASLTVSDGNLKVQASTTQWELARSTFFLNSGKHYWEFTWTGSVTGTSGYQMGLKTPESTLSAAAAQVGSYAFQYTTIYSTNGTTNSVVISPGSITSGDVVMFAYDADAGQMWIGVNGTWNGSGNPALGASPDWTNLPKTGLSPFAGCYGSSNTITLNAGQKAFEYTNHDGFSPLATSFLPEPAIKRCDEAMDVVVYEGNASVNKIQNLRMSPDLAWIKNYSSNTGYHHGWFDTVRGANKVIQTSTQANETTYTQQLTAFTDDGFELGNNSDSGNYVNLNGDDYYAWVWDAGENTTTIAAGALNSSAYDQSQTWSSSLTSTQTFNLATTRAFDGDATNSTLAATANATNANILFTKTFTGVTKLRVYMDHATSYRVRINGGTWHTDSSLGASSNASWRDLTSIIPANGTVNSIESDTGGQNNGVNWSAVEVNGRLLVDAINDSQTWSNGLTGLSNSTITNPTNGFDTDESSYADSTAGFTLDLSGHTFGTGAHTIEVKSGGATSFSVNGSTSLTDPGGGGAKVWTGTHTGELTSLASSATGASVYYIKIDGKYLANPGENYVTNVPSIPTTVRARSEAGFSIAKYQGNGSTSGPTIAHQLGTEPAFVLIKNLDGSQSYPDWYVKHKDIGDNYNTRFNLTAGRELATGSGSWYQGGIGNLDSKYALNFVTGAQNSTGNVNTNGVNYIAYCWAEVEGLSKFGKYTARSAPHFIYCGFAPALVICKSITPGTSESWLMTTWKSQNQNSFGKYMRTNSGDPEATTTDYMDLVSNGFVHRHNQGWNNYVGASYEYIFMAWAIDPFASNNRAR